MFYQNLFSMPLYFPEEKITCTFDTKSNLAKPCCYFHLSAWNSLLSLNLSWSDVTVWKHLILIGFVNM